MQYWLVMPAAGSGRRFAAGRPKQYARLEGRTVIEWALAPFLADRRCAGVMLALAPGDHDFARLAVPTGGQPAVSVTAGGAERSLSVRAALAALAPRASAADWVLVHDAARPCLAAADLERLLAGVAEHALGGLLAAPLADTLKRARDADGSAMPLAVAETVDRDGLWRALTPQMFRYARLCEALDAAHGAGRSPRDESQALEWLGESPLLIEGLASNIKVTTAADLALAAAVLRARQS